MRLYKDFLLPAGILSGTIIGAGVFALPFLFKSAGLSSGIFYLLLGGLVYAFIHLMYAEIILVTPGKHRFAGYAKIYLGNRVLPIVFLMTILQMIFVLTIYLVLSVSFTNLIFPSWSDTFKTGIFWLAGSFAIFLSLKRLAFTDFLVVGGMIFIILIIFVLGLDGFEKFLAVRFFPDLHNFLLPLGPILFAFAGRVAVPEVIAYFRLPGVRDKPGLIKKAIIFGTLIPALVYGLFVFGILGLTDEITPDAVSGLVGRISKSSLAAIGVLGILSLWSSYFIIGMDVKDSLNYDLKFSKIFRTLAVTAGPLFLYFLISKDFVALLGITGGIFIALEGIFIILIWFRMRRKVHHYILLAKAGPILASTLFLVFITAFIFELVKIF